MNIENTDTYSICNSDDKSKNIEIQVINTLVKDVKLSFKGVAELRVYRVEDNGSYRPFNSIGIKSLLPNVMIDWSSYDYEEKSDHI